MEEMGIREQYPLGNKEPEWSKLVELLNVMDKAGVPMAQTLSNNWGLTWLQNRDYTSPESFTNEEVWDMLEVIENNK